MHAYVHVVHVPTCINLDTRHVRPSAIEARLQFVILLLSTVIKLWQFLLELLTDRNCQDFIVWTSREWEFKFIDPEEVARRWGSRKNKPKMNYEKMSRNLWYYNDAIIRKVPGERYVYRFVCDLESMLGMSFSELQLKLKEETLEAAEPISTDMLHNLCVKSSFVPPRDSTLDPPIPAPPLTTCPDLICIAYDSEKTYKLIVFDFETTGLGRNAEICQIAAVGIKSDDPVWMKYILPDSDINPFASQVNGLTIDGNDSERRLLKDGNPVDTVSLEEGMSAFLAFLKDQSASVFRTILIAHKAATFDVPIFINSLHRCGVTADEFEERGIGFADSLLLLKQLQKKHPSLLVEGEPIRKLSLSSVYHCLFGEDFNCHEAVSDSLALRRVLFNSSLDVTLEQILAHSFTAASAWSLNDFHDNKNKLLRTMKGRLYSSYGGSVITIYMADKIAESGLGYDDLQEIYSKYGQKGIEQVFTSPRPLEPGQRKPKPRVTHVNDIIQSVVDHFQAN